MSKIAARSISAARTIAVLQASNTVSSPGTAGLVKYSICCDYDHSIKSALQPFPTGPSAIYSSLSPSVCSLML